MCETITKIKHLQIGWLRTRKFILSWFWRLEIQLRHSAGPCYLQRFKEELYFIKLRWLPASLGVPWLADVSFQSQAFLLCVLDCVSSLLIRTLVILVQHSLKLDMTSAKTLFANKVTSTDTGVRTSVCLEKWNWKLLGHRPTLCDPNSSPCPTLGSHGL